LEVSKFGFKINTTYNEVSSFTFRNNRIILPYKNG
jgi:hypothetical protein